jgi:hypothetical protein
MEQRQATPLHGRGLNPVDEHIEEPSLVQLEDIYGGFICILARFCIQQVYLRSKKEKAQQYEEELFMRVLFD